jgi:hypothetical protein
MGRIKEVTDRTLSESEGYHKRVKEFKNKICKLESEINDKQNNIVNHGKQSELKEKELKDKINSLGFELEKTKRKLSESELQKSQL